jgi:RimJ/RimL family protein N-acetyltransferase
MIMPARCEYFLHLSGLEALRPPRETGGLHLRAVQPADAAALAELMIEAYRGTIDYGNETLEDALAEVHAYFAGERGGPALPGASRCAFAGPLLVGACLAGEWDERRLPLIVYVMTSAAWKGRGIGRLVLGPVLQALQEHGHDEVRAVITEGNLPSEQLFRRMGFRRAARP